MTGDDLTEAFLWSEYRTVTKTATISLHGNTYQVDAALVGRKVELVFSPFDLETLDVRYRDKSHGKAVPHRITRHVHPKARRETSEPVSPPVTGIDYLTLTADTHHAQVSRERRIGFDALYGNRHTEPGSEPSTVADGQIPGQLSIDDNNESNESNEVGFG